MADTIRPAPSLPKAARMATLLQTRPMATTSLQTAFALVACQRSGTHLLGEILNSHPQLAVPSEPFSPSPQQVCWTNYVRRLTDEQRFPRSSVDVMDLIDRYVEAMSQAVGEDADWCGGAKSSNRSIGLDVKYNQLGYVRPIYFDLRARPLLLEYFGRRRIPIIHLVRRNVLHVAISIIVANQREVWHVYNQASPPVRCYIPTDLLLDRMHWAQEERNEFLRLSAGLRIHNCEYEDVVADLAKVKADGSFGRDASAVQGIAKFLGVDADFRFEGRIRKVLDRPYSETIENYQEVVKAIRKSEFSTLVATI